MTQEHPEHPKGELIDELRELVESWEGTDTDPTLYRDSLTRAINELQEIIDRYE